MNKRTEQVLDSIDFILQESVKDIWHFEDKDQDYYIPHSICLAPMTHLSHQFLKDYTEKFYGESHKDTWKKAGRRLHRILNQLVAIGAFGCERTLTWKVWDCELWNGGWVKTYWLADKHVQDLVQEFTTTRGKAAELMLEILFCKENKKKGIGNEKR